MKITVLNPNNKKEKKRVAAYARVSTVSEGQEESFASQVKYYEHKFKGNPKVEFIGVYADHGFSATQAKNRPEFLRLIKDATDGKIDVIYCKSVSRFARNAAECQEYTRELKDKNVEVYFEEQDLSSFNPMSEMVFNFLTVVAQEESRSISENILWGKEKQAEKGIRHLGGKTPFGYKEVGDSFEPDQNAWVVTYIFEEYAKERNPSDIARDLEKYNIKRKRTDKPIDSKFIREVIKQDFYTGDRVIQKGPHRNYLTHKPDASKEYKTYFLENDHPALVSKELFKVCTKIAKRRKKQKPWRKIHKTYFQRTGNKVMKGKNSSPLYGLVICTECGECYERISSYVRAKVPYKKWVWNCKGKEKKICFGTHSIDEEKILKTIDGIPFEEIERIEIDRNKNITVLRRRQ